MQRVIALCRGVTTALVMLLTVNHRAAAASEFPGDLFEGTSACPEPRAVWSALSALVGGERLEERLRTLPDGAPAVALTDLGVAFRVRAGNQTRDYQDELRDCANRARLAALFVELAIDSVEQTAQPKANGPPAPPAASPTVVIQEPAPSPPRQHIVNLELGVDGLLGVRPLAAAPGALAGVSVGRRRLALVVNVRGSFPTDVTMAGLRVRQWRAAADVALRARWLPDRPVTPFVELGVVGALLSERAPDLAMQSAHLAREVGVAVGGGVGFCRRSWGSAFFLVQGEVDPDPPALSALPTGNLGRTPYVWLGAAAGLALGLF